MKSHRLWILKLMLLGQVVLLFGLVYRATGDGRYFLVHEDEVINFCSAIVFDETTSVRAEGCINENVSSIGQMNWYGPGYSVFYGSLRGIFGDAPYLFVWIHFILAMATLGLVFLLHGNLENRLLMANALAFTWQYSAYIFTYFPESLILCMALLLILLLLKINESNDQGSKLRYILLYSGFVVIFMLFRVTFVFWLVGLVGVSRSLKEGIRLSVWFVVAVVLALVYMKFFTAPPYAGEMQKIDKLFEFSIVEFILKTVWALMRNSGYLLVSGSIEVYFLLAMVLVVAIRWWKTKERLLLATMLVSGTVIAALLAYYSPGPSYFLKQSDALVPLLLAALMFSISPSTLKSSVVLTALIIFIFSYQKIWKDIQDRRDAFARYEENSDLRTSFQEMTSFINEDYPVT
ncbi:MAG TPA: hypothetical protein PLR06_13830, partial [Cyclobacteriaceae bacterium]|nr:hypothetical protein [Cyclobacteriaceae bacterium]